MKSILALSFLSSLPSTTSAIVRGISSKQTSDYSQNDNKIECLGTYSEYGPSVTIQATINDDYCDCEDGRDEPGTSACSNVLPTSTNINDDNEVVGSTFYCENKGANPKRIFKSRVSDGICDCCDGSDENGIGCSNTCLEDGKAWREERIRQAAHIRQGIVVKETYVELGKAKILEIEEKRKILENELNNLHSLTSELENNKLIMEQKETEEKRKYQLSFKVDHASILKRSRILEVLKQFTKDDGNLGDDIVGDGNVVATNQDEHKDDYKVDDFGKDLLQFALKNNVMSQFREFLLERLPSNANERNTLPLPNNVDTSSSNNEINQLDDDIQEQLNTMLKETEGEGMEDIRQEAIVSLHF
jgi:hypothetical protein